jgi:hypothetical protein
MRLRIQDEYGRLYCIKGVSEAPEPQKDDYIVFRSEGGDIYQGVVTRRWIDYIDPSHSLTVNVAAVKAEYSPRDDEIVY